MILAVHTSLQQLCARHCGFSLPTLRAIAENPRLRALELGERTVETTELLALTLRHTGLTSLSLGYASKLNFFV